MGRDFRARSVIGIDIDRELIKIAKKNFQYYINLEQSPATRSPAARSPAAGSTIAGSPAAGSTAAGGTSPSAATEESQKQKTDESNEKRVTKTAHSNERFFPISMPIVYGPVDIPGITDGLSKTPSAPKPFPLNVTFVQVSLNSHLSRDSFLRIR